MISVDRAFKSIGIFDGIDLLRPFEPYTDEAAGVAAARAWLRERTSQEPRLVYPRITKMTTTWTKPRRR
jgi:hypothetical protein